MSTAATLPARAGRTALNAFRHMLPLPPQGREIESHGRGGGDAPFAEDDRVTVICDPANPSRVRIASFLDLWLPSAVRFDG